MQVIDLWQAEEDAGRLYRLYLARLQMNGLHSLVVSGCRQIRRYAARGPGREEGTFTFEFEINSLCELKNYKAAWRQLRLRDGIMFGRPFDVTRRRWSAAYADELAYTYAPLLYFLGRHRLGCALLETSLGFWFRRKKDVQSYELLFHVYNSDEEPRERPRVTLRHFYRRLGKRLDEWQKWDAFVNGFPAKLFRMAGVEREVLLADSAKLPEFFNKLMEIRDSRTTSGVTRGQVDLLDSPGKVRKWQEATREKLRRFNEDRREQIDAKLRQAFPELRRLG